MSGARQIMDGAQLNIDEKLKPTACTCAPHPQQDNLFVGDMDVCWEKF